MSKPKIIVIPGSARTGSHNARLGAVIAKQLNDMGAEAQLFGGIEERLSIWIKSSLISDHCSSTVKESSSAGDS